jgi:hypothetical protein
MAYEAKVYRILIISPSDVGEERKIAEKVIHQWNSNHSSVSGIVLLPLMWETDVYSDLSESDDPQLIINKQIVDECDLAVAIFWNRIGSKTPRANSGSSEEILKVLKSKKHLLVGFSEKSASVSNLDLKQITKLKEYRKECERKGIIFTFSSNDEFQYSFLNQLTQLLSKSQKFSIKKTISLRY